jgi:hypothetical protein
MLGGKPGTRMEKETKTALYEKAKKYDIPGRSKMNKAELVAAIRSHHNKVGEKLRKRK